MATQSSDFIYGPLHSAIVERAHEYGTAFRTPAQVRAWLAEWETAAGGDVEHEPHVFEGNGEHLQEFFLEDPTRVKGGDDDIYAISIPRSGDRFNLVLNQDEIPDAPLAYSVF